MLRRPLFACTLWRPASSPVLLATAALTTTAAAVNNAKRAQTTTAPIAKPSMMKKSMCVVMSSLKTRSASASSSVPVQQKSEKRQHSLGRHMSNLSLALTPRSALLLSCAAKSRTTLCGSRRHCCQTDQQKLRDNYGFIQQQCRSFFQGHQPQSDPRSQKHRADNNGNNTSGNNNNAPPNPFSGLTQHPWFQNSSNNQNGSGRQWGNNGSPFFSSYYYSSSAQGPWWKHPMIPFLLLSIALSLIVPGFVLLPLIFFGGPRLLFILMPLFALYLMFKNNSQKHTWDDGQGRSGYYWTTGNMAQPPFYHGSPAFQQHGQEAMGMTPTFPHPQYSHPVQTTGQPNYPPQRPQGSPAWFNDNNNNNHPSAPGAPPPSPEAYQQWQQQQHQQGQQPTGSTPTNIPIQSYRPPQQQQSSAQQYKPFMGGGSSQPTTTDPLYGGGGSSRAA